MNFRMNKIVWIPLLLRFYASGLNFIFDLSISICY